MTLLEDMYAEVRLNEKLANIVSWFSFSVSTKKKHISVFRLTSCKKMGMIVVVVLNKRWVFRRRKKK